jgi:hypothetical protein
MRENFERVKSEKRDSAELAGLKTDQITRHAALRARADRSESRLYAVAASLARSPRWSWSRKDEPTLCGCGVAGSVPSLELEQKSLAMRSSSEAVPPRVDHARKL